jgi:hypothetical protein
MSSRKLLVLVIALALASGASAHRLPSEVVRFPFGSRPLAVRLDWGLKEAAGRGYRSGFWEGYSIRRLMGKRSSIGSFSSDAAWEPTFEEVITGKKKGFPDSEGRESVRREALLVLEDMKKKGQPEEKVWKDVAVLSLYEGVEQKMPSRVEMSSLDLPFNFKGLPLLWLGGADDVESLAWLKTVYAGSRTDEAKKRVLAAVGMHQSPALALPILEAALDGRESVSLRKDAAFWMGQQDDPRACVILLRAARADRSIEVRKHAVFALSQVELESSVDGLIELARTADDGEVRKQAVFWLSEKASRKALATLEEIADRDPEPRVQEQALFALSQLPDQQGVSALIKVARTHPNPRLRKKAIFWLGECGDHRAVEVLIEIVKKN